MKPAVHQYEDKLLEFAYGELARQEADAVEAHVRGCARCTQALEEIRGVRQTMAQLPMVAAPDAGLDSLLAYAEQAAKRNASEKPAAASGWRRFLAPLALVMTLVTVGVVGYRAKDEFDTSPATAAADAKLDKLEEARAKAKDEAPPAPATPIVAAQPQVPADLPMAAGPQPHPAPKADERAAAAGDVDGNLDAKLAKQPEPEVSELAYNKKGGKTAAPQSVTRRAFNQTGKDLADTKSVQDESALEDGLLQKNNAPPPPPPAAKFDNNDSMNAGAGLAKEEAKRDATKTLETTKSPPKPAAVKSKKPQLAPKDVAEPNEAWAPSPSPMADQQQPQPQEKPTFGLGTGGAQQVPSNRPEPKVVTEGEAESSLRAGKNRQEAEKRAAEEDQRKEIASKQAADKKAEKQQASAPPTVAVVQPSAPAPVAAPPQQPQGSSGYDGKKSSYTLGPLAGSTSSSPGRGAAVQGDDALSVRPSTDRLDNDDANKLATQRAQFSGDAIESARMASNRGDRRGEIQFALKALQTGATGSTRAEALARICEAYEALGESGSGETYCVQLMKEFPTVPAAQRVAERRNQYRVSPAKKAAPKSERERKATDFESLDEKPKPADAAPAQSY